MSSETDVEFDRVIRKVKRSRGCLTCGVCFILIIVIYFSASVFITKIPAGNIGVVDVFGSVSNEYLVSGIHLVSPFSKIILFSTQTQIITMSETVPSKEGMEIKLEAAALFHLDPQRGIAMYKEVGENYIDKVVVPQFRSVLRSVTSAHDAKDLYSAQARISMTAALKAELTELLFARGLIVESTPLKNLVLPITLQNAIQEKLRAEQESQKMEFILQKEEQEAQRKTIEAKGIQEFQDIVRRGIDDHLLRWKGIEATEKLAHSPNSKLIIIGSGTAGGLPIILNPPEE